MRESCNKITDFLKLCGKKNTIYLFERISKISDYYRFAKIDECTFAYKYADKKSQLIIVFNKLSKPHFYRISYKGIHFNYDRFCTSQESIINILKSIELMEFLGRVKNE